MVEDFSIQFNPLYLHKDALSINTEHPAYKSRLTLVNTIDTMR